MKALKALVIGMGILIVIGIGLVGLGLSRSRVKQEQPPLVAISAGGEPFATEVAVPRDAAPQQVLSAGDRIVLRYSDKLLIIDARTGKLAGTVVLVPETEKK